MTEIVDERLGDPLNYISVKLPSRGSFEKNQYLFLNRHYVELRCIQEQNRLWLERVWDHEVYDSKVRTDTVMRSPELTDK